MRCSASLLSLNGSIVSLKGSVAGSNSVKKHAVPVPPTIKDGQSTNAIRCTRLINRSSLLSQRTWLELYGPIVRQMPDLSEPPGTVDVFDGRSPACTFRRDEFRFVMAWRVGVQYRSLIPAGPCGVRKPQL